MRCRAVAEARFRKTSRSAKAERELFHSPLNQRSVCANSTFVAQRMCHARERNRIRNRIAAVRNMDLQALGHTHSCAHTLPTSCTHTNCILHLPNFKLDNAPYHNASGLFVKAQLLHTRAQRFSVCLCRSCQAAATECDSVTLAHKTTPRRPREPG